MNIMSHKIITTVILGKYENHAVVLFGSSSATFSYKF